MNEVGCKEIFVLIPIHNGIAFTQKCLRSLHESIKCISTSGYRVELVVIDDGSTDGSSDLISGKWPEVHIVKGDGDLWWSGSINAGIKYCLKRYHPDFFMLFNNDCLVKEEFFVSLIRQIESHGPGIILVSKVYDLAEPDKVFSMGAIFDPVLGVDQVISHKCRHKYNLNSEINVDWSGGMGVLIPKCVFEKVGFFDEKNFPQYKGDFDFFLRANGMGFRLVASPNLEVWNDKGQSGHHVQNLQSFLRSFIDKRSRMNVYENMRFYGRHSYLGIFCWGFLYRYIKHIAAGTNTILKELVKWGWK